MQAHGADAEEERDGLILRSLLFVPADSETKLAKAASVPADALILDLEDSVAPDRRPAARALVREFLKGDHAQSVWVRVNPLGSDDFIRDIEAVTASKPAGLVIPKPDGPHALQVIDGHLITRETAAGIAHGAIKLLPIAAETPAAVLNLAHYADPPPRLAALAWGAEDLAAALGAAANRDGKGEFLLTYRIVRSLSLIAAKAAGVLAIETLYADFRDSEGLARMAADARREGFDGMLAIHPAQVEIINAAFTPSPAEIDHAKKVVAAFAGGAGVAALDGRMLDAAHLKQAQHILALAGALLSRR